MENVTKKKVGRNSRLYYTLLSFVFKNNALDGGCSLSLRMWPKYHRETQEAFPCSINCSMVCCCLVTICSSDSDSLT